MNWINRWLIKCQLFSESCEVTPKNRKGCQFCRFKKCLGCGMKVSQCPSHQWINPSQSDEGHSPCLYNKVSLFIFNFVQNIYFSSLRLKRCWDLVQVSVIDFATIHADTCPGVLGPVRWREEQEVQQVQQGISLFCGMGGLWRGAQMGLFLTCLTRFLWDITI